MTDDVKTSRYWVFAAICVLGISTDLYSKSRVFSELGYPDGRSRILMNLGEQRILFRLYTSMNEGALWGIGQGKSYLFALLSMVAIGGILYWLFVKKAAVSSWLTVALAFIMSGTVGNLYDRMAWHGCTLPNTDRMWYAVRDFLLFSVKLPSGNYWSWPVFNFADVFLVTGAIMLVLQAIFTPVPSTSASSKAIGALARD